MKHLLRLTDMQPADMRELFRIAEEVKQGAFQNSLAEKTVVMFFPETSIRTRVTFEKGIHLLGGQTILFPPAVLDKEEKIEDVIGYLNNWADAVIVRHKSIALMEEMAVYADFPIINAMTDDNHPCEMLADMYALSKRRKDFTKDAFLFLGADGNIGRAWREAAAFSGFSLRQCCPKGYEMEGVEVVYDLYEAIKGIDIVCTDSIPAAALRDFEGYQITAQIMGHANPGALLNPCPPFYRGREVSTDAIDSEYFAGYAFKKELLSIQQAAILYLQKEGKRKKTERKQEE